MSATQERRVIQSSLARLWPSLLRSFKTPGIGELLSHSAPWEDVADDVAPSWRDYASEYSEVENTLAARYRATQLVFPQDFSAGTHISRVLYFIVRARKPQTVLETGVANGHMTVVLLAALGRNEGGELHSTDVRPDVGCLLSPSERRSWNYHLLPPAQVRTSFTAVLKRLPTVDLFFHDSQHGYGWQSFEYEAVSRHMSPDGVIASDDVDSSYAFLDFCATHEREPRLVFDGKKTAGVAPASSPQPLIATSTRR
jgi:predicted O-methyltransferase YrrM